MKVTLLSITPNALEQIYRAYRICYSGASPTEIKMPIKDDLTIDFNKVNDFIVPLMVEGHTTPLEHVSVSFAIEGASRACTHQLVRHRTGKYNQQSQRYVKLDQFEYVIPPAIKNNNIAREAFIQHMQDSQRAYDGIAFRLEQDYLSAGMNKREATKKAIEDARYVFPNACCSNIIVTMDLNNLRKFLALRLCINSQWEIRNLAKEMLKLVESEIPFIGNSVMNCGKTCNRCIEEII